MGKDLNGKELGKGICQRKNGKYYARFVNRFGERDGVYGDTLKEVRNKLAQAMADDSRRKNVVDKNITLDEWHKQWMEVYKRAIRLSTKRQYDYIYDTKISPSLGKLKICEITKIQVVKLLNMLADQSYEWETLNKVKILLIDMFEKALEDEFVVRNPAKGVRLPKNRTDTERKALSREDQDAFFECSAGTFYHNLFVVAVNTGLRPGELFALTKEDIDFENKTINVDKTLLYQKLDGDEQKEFHIEPPKTKSSKRTVPINKICENALIKQIIQQSVIQKKTSNLHEKKKRKEEFPDLLFTTKFGTPLNSQLMSDAIKHIVEEINLTRDTLDEMEKFGGHVFRHTFATRCFEAGIPPKTVQAYLGHASLQMTMDHYTSVLKEKEKDDMKKLEDTIGVKGPGIEDYQHNIIRFCV